MMEGAREVNAVKTVRKADSNFINNCKIVRSAWDPIPNGWHAIAWSCDFLLETN